MYLYGSVRANKRLVYTGVLVSSSTANEHVTLASGWHKKPCFLSGQASRAVSVSAAPRPGAGPVPGRGRGRGQGRGGGGGGCLCDGSTACLVWAAAACVALERVWCRVYSPLAASTAAGRHAPSRRRRHKAALTRALRRRSVPRPAASRARPGGGGPRLSARGVELAGRQATPTRH